MALIQYLTQLHFDFAAATQLPRQCQRAAMLRPLVISDAGVCVGGALDLALAAWGEHPPPIYKHSKPNPNQLAVHRALAGHTLAEDVQPVNQRLGLPAGLADLGVDPSMFEHAVTGVMTGHSRCSKPRPATRDDYLAMLASSL
jgi:alcohol dehydrogenase class IV